MKYLAFVILLSGSRIFAAELTQQPIGSSAEFADMLLPGLEVPGIEISGEIGIRVVGDIGETGTQITPAWTRIYYSATENSLYIGRFKRWLKMAGGSAHFIKVDLGSWSIEEIEGINQECFQKLKIKKGEGFEDARCKSAALKDDYKLRFGHLHHKGARRKSAWIYPPTNAADLRRLVPYVELTGRAGEFGVLRRLVFEEPPLVVRIESKSVFTRGEGLTQENGSKVQFRFARLRDRQSVGDSLSPGFRREVACSIDPTICQGSRSSDSFGDFLAALFVGWLASVASDDEYQTPFATRVFACSAAHMAQELIDDPTSAGVVSASLEALLKGEDVSNVPAESAKEVLQNKLVSAIEREDPKLARLVTAGALANCLVQ